MEVNINEKKTKLLTVADDVVLIYNNFEDLQQILEDLTATSQHKKLKINLSKTKIKTKYRRQQTNFHFFSPFRVGQRIFIPGIVYQTIQRKPKADKDRKIGLARAASGKLSNHVKNKKIFIKFQSRIFSIRLLPVLIYGAQSTFTQTNL